MRNGLGNGIFQMGNMGKKENPRLQNFKFEKFPLIVHGLIFEIKHIEYLLTLSSI
jgi:hypothetical protein